MVRGELAIRVVAVSPVEAVEIPISVSELIIGIILRIVEVILSDHAPRVIRVPHRPPEVVLRIEIDLHGVSEHHIFLLGVHVDLENRLAVFFDEELPIVVDRLLRRGILIEFEYEPSELHILRKIEFS